MRDLLSSGVGSSRPWKSKRPAVAQISAQLLGQKLLALDPLAIARWREAGDALLSQRGRGIDREQFAQVVKFQNAVAGVLDGIGHAHRRTNLWYRSAAATL